MKYIDADKLKAEIERRIALYSRSSEYNIDPNRIDEDEQLLSFLDTLSEEPDKDLEKAARKYTKKNTCYNRDPDLLRSSIKDAFIAGAEWGAERNKQNQLKQ